MMAGGHVWNYRRSQYTEINENINHHVNSYCLVREFQKFSKFQQLILGAWGPGSRRQQALMDLIGH